MKVFSVIFLIAFILMACTPPKQTSRIFKKSDIASIDTLVQIHAELATINSQLKELKEELHHSRNDDFNPLRIPGGGW